MEKLYIRYLFGNKKNGIEILLHFLVKYGVKTPIHTVCTDAECYCEPYDNNLDDGTNTIKMVIQLLEIKYWEYSYNSFKKCEKQPNKKIFMDKSLKYATDALLESIKY